MEQWQEKIKILKNLGLEEIEENWKEYHKNSNNICAVIPSQTYHKLKERTNKYPRFILPLPSQNHGMIEFIYMEATGDLILFTRLSEFKELGSKAGPLLTMYHFTDLDQDKNVILMRGEINCIKTTTGDASVLTSLYQIFYLKDDLLKQVEIFNTQPNQFDFNNLLKGLHEVT